jgi:protein-disulfide isomerase
MGPLARTRMRSWGCAAAGALLGLGLLALPAAAQEQSLPGGFSPDQAQGIENIVREYLMAHPEVLVEALTEYQKRLKMADEQNRQQAIVAHMQDLTADPTAPVMGNPAGDVVVVEFFDYRCPYCKSVAKMVRDVVAGDGKVRLVMKEFPILGPPSVQAAKAALAAVKQGKYEAFHFALMTQPGDMSDAHIETVAGQVGLDVAQLKADMTSPEITAVIDRNIALAETIGIQGTPAFIVGKTLVPGAINADNFRKLIAKVRAEAS